MARTRDRHRASRPLASVVACVALTVLPAATRAETSLQSFAGVVGGFANRATGRQCGTFGRLPELEFFGGFAAQMQVLGGNDECGYRGGWTNRTTTDGTPSLSTQASLEPTLQGNPGYALSFSGTAAATATYGVLDVSAHGRLTGSYDYTAPGALQSSAAAALFTDTFSAHGVAFPVGASSEGFVRYRFDIAGTLLAPGPYGPYRAGELVSQVAVQQDDGPVYGIWNGVASIGRDSAVLGSTLPGWTLLPGSIAGQSIVASPMLPLDLAAPWTLKAGLVATIYGSADAAFPQGATLVGIDLYDHAGNALEGGSVTSEGGQAFGARPVTPVPEPAQAWLLLGGLLALATWVRRRGRFDPRVGDDGWRASL